MATTEGEARSVAAAVVRLPSPAASPAIVGGKGHHLHRLMTSGLPVPPAFVINADGYRAHAAQASIQAAMATARSAPAATRARCLAALRTAIVSAPLDAALAAAIGGAVQELGARVLAVRSSATAEDAAGHSFAGQHDSFLGVIGSDACGDAVRRCWASLWTERAVAYRAQHGLGGDEAAMAVVVQRCVAAEVAGVLFTCDPLTHDGGRVVIESVFGLGETLVAGRVAPERIVVDKSTLAVIERQLGQQSVELVTDEAGGTRTQAVAPARAQTPCLDPVQTRRLAELGIAVERAFGGPQDIEWAIAGEDIYLLQARPVTTVPRTDDPADRQVWADMNAGEVLPGVLTPMTFSVVRRFVDALVRLFLSRLTFDVAGAPLLGLIAGRAYFNMNTVVALLSSMPLLRRDAVHLFGGDPQLAPALARLTPQDLPQAGTSRWRVLAHLPGAVGWLLRHLGVRADHVLARLGAATAVLEQVNPSQLTDAALRARIDAVFADVDDLAEGFTFAAVGIACASQLGVVCQRWLNDGNGALASRLLSGLGGLDSAEAGLDLWRLAAAARAAPVAAAIAPDGAFAAWRDTIADSDAGRAFLSQWDTFMARHGHHTRVELDVTVPRWREQPDYVLGMIRSYLADDAAPDPVAAHRQRAAEREALTRACRRLGAPRRWVFNWLLARAQRGTALRENVKSEAVRRIAVVRATLLEIGTRLAARGVLTERDAVFFLTLEEAGAALQGDAAFDIAATVAARRAEHAANLTITPPAVVVGRFHARRWLAPSAAPPGTPDAVLRGLAVSPGLVRGRARVITRADADARVLAGEILVAPFTDPGWTPYFLPAAGIVMDVGGALSHGSVVAREYGIPAVVNVGPATQIIRTGDLVEVDGYRGEVRVLERSGASGVGRSVDLSSILSEEDQP